MVTASYGGESIVVLANREPYRHDRAQDGSITVSHAAGGLVTALEPLIESCSGVWVAHGSGTADRCVVDGQDRLRVPPANPKYRVRRVWLSPNEARGYYSGFANQGLWPLCHRTRVRPVFCAGDFATYQSVNNRFAEAVCEEIQSGRPLVLVQDYHFALAPRRIRERLPLSTIVTFWHVPWPHPRDFAMCPWAAHLLEGLLASSIVGFQTPEDSANFVETVETLLDARIDRRKAIDSRDRATAVRVYPVSVEWPGQWTHRLPAPDQCAADVRRRLGLAPDTRLIVGVDRLDYTKGLEQKVSVIERLLELHPEFRGRVVLAQIAEPSREGLPAYQACQSRLAEAAQRVNLRFGAGRYRPIVLLQSHHEPDEVHRFLRAADVCYVGSLHDGMNLVAKEFVASRDDHRGVLILSEYAGAAKELMSAVIVNPTAIDACAEALVRALRMPVEEQSARMRKLRSVVAINNTYRWAGEMLTDAACLRAGIAMPAQPSQTGWRSTRANALADGLSLQT